MTDRWPTIVIATPTGIDDDDAVFKALLDALPDRPEHADYVVTHPAGDKRLRRIAWAFCEDQAAWMDNAGAYLYAEPAS